MNEDLKQKVRIWFENKYGESDFTVAIMKEALFEVFLEGFESALWEVGYFNCEPD